MTVISDMLHTICINCTKPHIVILAPRVEKIDSYVRPAHLRNQSSISTISNVDCTVLLGSVSD
jgi:phosphatidate phosphatase APP1